MLIAALLALAYNRLEDLRQLSKREVQNNLAGVAELKAHEIEYWLIDREEDATLFSNNDRLGNWLLAGAPQDARGAAILQRLVSIQDTYHYAEIRLLDNTATVRFSTSKSPEEMDATAKQLALAAMRSGKAQHSDLAWFRKADESVLNIDIVAPLFIDDDRGRRVVGALVFCIDPYQFLYPLIQSWPTPSRSAETLLVRRDGNDVLYLNELRHRSGTALKFRLPLSSPDLPEALAVRGYHGIIEGTDYRHVSVLAAARNIAGTPWYMVAKVDQEEVYAPIQKIVVLATILGIFFVVAASTLALFWWRQQQAYYLARQYQSDLENFARLQHVDSLAKYANGAILLLDSSDRIIDANDGAVELYGYRREELLQLHFDELKATDARADTGAEIRPPRMERRGEVLCEAFHQRKDKSTLAVEINVEPLKVDGQWFRQTFVRDITERKEAEKFRRLTQHMMENLAEGIVLTDAENRIVWINPAFTRINGYTLEEVIGKTPSFLHSGHHTPDFYEGMWASIEREGHWQGEIWDRKKSGELYQEWLSITAVRDNEGQVRHHIGVFADITQQKEGEERIRFLATHDALTELPNRNLFMDSLQVAINHAKRDAANLAVLFVDLDLFKRINDTLGHHLGDKLLQAVAKRFQECLREADMVARLGGDEFTVILEDLMAPEDAAMVAQKFIESLSKPFDIDGHQLAISPSIGISIYPGDGEDVSTLLKNADVAMYRAKSESRNTYRFFSREMTMLSQEHMMLENSLRHALEREELLLYYQPQIDVTNRRVIGVEVLLRWQHPKLGMLMPNKFIPLAEESGLILPIGEWVLKTACEKCAECLQLGYPPFRIAVNLSARQFSESNLPELISRILRETKLAPHLLELEVTEGSVMSHGEDAINILKTLRDMGVHIAIDDFGTGYSNLSYLKRFPIDTIKIDRLFISDIPSDSNDAAITKAIITLGESMGHSIIAEGVETQEQLDFLTANGCRYVQGFLFATPMPVAEMAAFLKANAEATAVGSA